MKNMKKLLIMALAALTLLSTPAEAKATVLTGRTATDCRNQ